MHCPRRRPKPSWFWMHSFRGSAPPRNAWRPSAGSVAKANGVVWGHGSPGSRPVVPRPPFFRRPTYPGGSLVSALLAFLSGPAGAAGRTRRGRGPHYHLALGRSLRSRTGPTAPAVLAANRDQLANG